MIPDPPIPSHPKPIFLTKALLVDSSEISLGLDHPLDLDSITISHHPFVLFKEPISPSLSFRRWLAGRCSRFCRL